MKEFTFKSRLTNGLQSFFFKKKKVFKDRVIESGEGAINLFDENLKKKDFCFVSLSHYATRLIYEYQKDHDKDSDYSKKLYLPDDYRIHSTLNNISKFALDHVANEFIKDLDKVDQISWLKLNKEERMLVKCAPSSVSFSLDKERFLDETKLYQHLDNKRVLVLSPYSELIKIQHLHQEVFHRSNKNVKGNFELLVLNIEEIFHQKDAYSLFDKLDALKVEILKYDFDICLIDLSLLGLPVAAFVKSLGKQALDLGDELYQIFGIALDSAEKSSKDKFWIDLSSYKKGIESTFLATGVIGAPIKMKKNRGKKRVH